MKPITQEEIETAGGASHLSTVISGTLAGNDGMGIYLEHLGVENPEAYRAYLLELLQDPIVAAIYSTGFAHALQIFKLRELTSVDTETATSDRD